MICSKCNSEIPNGARFCTVCGAACETAAPAASEQKNLCAKCNSELNPGSKFCTVCGTPVASAPTDAAAVSLNKEPNANDLVATMNAAAAAVPTPVPTPAASVPTPTPVPTPVATAPAPEAPAPAVPTPTPTPAPTYTAPATPAADYNNGFAVPTAGVAPAAPQAPTFAPSANGAMPPMGDVNGLNGVAAAVAAPAKKKGGAGKIVLIISIVLVALLGGAAAFFFTNKATALSIVMGKPKYAAMIEKESLKEITENLDMENLSEQIKSVSGVVSTVLATNASSPYDIYDLYDIGYLSADKEAPEIVKLMNATSYPIEEGVDVKALIKGYNEYMKSLYGVSRISATVSANISLSDELSDEYTDEMLSIINGAEFTYDVAATDKLIGTEFGMKLKGKTIDTRMVIEEDGSVYFMFPFATDKALKYKLTTVESSAAEVTEDASVVLDLDSKEIERLINEVVDIYSNYIKESSVTMEKGSLNVGGIVVEGKEITADINGKNLENLFKAVFEHIADDQYFCDKIVEYVKSFDPEFTASDYKNAITDAVRDMSSPTESDKLIVTTIVNNSGKVLAKSYTIASDGEKIGSIAFADNDTTTAFDIKAGNESLFTLTNVKTSDSDGRVTVTFGAGSTSSMSVIVDYEGVGEADFGTTTVPVGTYTVKFDISGLSTEDLDLDELDMLNSFEFKIKSSVSGSTADSSVSCSIQDLFDVSINAKVTLSDDVSKFSAPSNVLDITSMVEGEASDKDMEEFFQYISDVLGGMVNSLDGTGLDELIEDLMDEMSSGMSPVEPDPLPTEPDDTKVGLKSFYDNVDELEDVVWAEYMDVYGWFDYYDYSGDYENDPAYVNAMEYREKLYELDDRLWDAIFDEKGASKEEIKAFNDEFFALYAQRDALRRAVVGDTDNETENPDNTTTGPNEQGGLSDEDMEALLNELLGQLT